MADRVSWPGTGPAVPVKSAGGPVNGFQILERVAGLPVSTWRYSWEPPEVRHLGPMAQDWAAAFGLGMNDTTIAGVDANGVALVSIQALYQLVGDLRQEVTELRKLVRTKIDAPVSTVDPRSNDASVQVAATWAGPRTQVRRGRCADTDAVQ